MILRLHHQRPDGEVDVYHLKSGRRYHIGRGSNCQVRILDLRLSRQHCAIEYANGEWRVVDIGSTNGCSVDGDLIAGSAILQQGTRIDIGQTRLSVLQILGEDEVEDEADDDSGQREPLTSTTLRPPPAEAAAEAPAPAAETSATAMPASRPMPAPTAPPLEEAATLPTLPVPPAPAPAAPQPATERQDERTFFITVLGRRIGPLTRAQARELKARELRGTLTAADLADLPAPRAADQPASA